MEQAVKKLLVTVKERGQFVWKGEHHMEIRGVDNLRPAFVHPDLLLDSLAFGTVTVSAGIIVEFYVSAVRTLAYITAEFSRLTV